MTESVPEEPELKRSSRDSNLLREKLNNWLRTVLPEGSNPEVSDLRSTSTTGMSSESILFEAQWSTDGNTAVHKLVARIAPSQSDVPVFPEYNLTNQFNSMRNVADASSVPVPEALWLEEDPGSIGSAFFVMRQVVGDVPPDVMPYNFGDSWLFSANASQQQKLQDSTIGILGSLHSIQDATERFAFLEYGDDGEDHLTRHIANRYNWYKFVKGTGPGSDLIENGFAWLDSNRPERTGTSVLSWGDSRIGNVMYRDFEPVAVLDWEMAGLGPRELDIAWMIYGHRVFEDLAHQYELVGMPNFLNPSTTASSYEAITGYTPQHLTYYLTYAAIQFGIVFLRTGQRSIHFGEREEPTDVDELLYNREPLARMLEGTYWE